ncbi:unnamed protein product [Rotaria magnacalcarata]
MMSETEPKIRVAVVPVRRENIHSSIHKKYKKSILSDDLHSDKMSGISTAINKFKSNTVSPTSMHPLVIEMHETSSIKRHNIIHPHSIRTTKNKFNEISASSSSKLFSSTMNHNASNGLWSMKSMEEYQEQKPKRRSRRYTLGVLEDGLETTAKNTEKNKTDKRNRRCIGKICPACSTCCCVSISIGILLLLMGITALLVFFLTNTRSVTTTVTTTTSTTATSTTSVTTTTTSTTTTPSPPCIPSSVGSASTLLTISSPNETTYSCYAYAWTSPTTGSVTFMFELRNDPGQWYVDDTSVYQGGTQMLTNIGFETGSLSPWVRTGPYGSCGGYVARICNYSCRSGSYCACDGSNSCADELSQQFTATAGQVYVVSFWLSTDSLGSGISATVTLS